MVEETFLNKHTNLELYNRLQVIWNSANFYTDQLIDMTLLNNNIFNSLPSL